jgi:hypothetical protein
MKTGALLPAGPLFVVLLALALLLGGCATAPKDETARAAPARPSAAGSRLKPMAVRPLEVKADCRYKDEVGYEVSTRLDVSYAEVRDFAASVKVPRRGSCTFDGPFKQTRRLPSVQLSAADGCTVNIWEQGPQVTVGFANCASRCTRGTFDYVYPIIVDRDSGQCH